MHSHKSAGHMRPWNAAPRTPVAGSGFWLLAVVCVVCGVSWCATRLAWLASGVLVVGRAAPDRAAERRAPGPAAVDVNKTEVAVQFPSALPRAELELEPELEPEELELAPSFPCPCPPPPPPQVPPHLRRLPLVPPGPGPGPGRRKRGTETGPAPPMGRRLVL
jgi:hypothetical protein